MEGVATALEVLAGALAQLDKECGEILAVVTVAAAAVMERTELAGVGTSSSETGGRAAAGTSVALRQALTAHGRTRHRAHQLGAALVTVTLDASEAQALAMLLSRGDALPRRRARRRPTRPRHWRVRTAPELRPGERRSYGLEQLGALDGVGRKVSRRP